MLKSTSERWLPVVGWELLYEVSDHGRVRNAYGIRGRIGGFIIAATPNEGGYLRVRLNAGHRSYSWKRVHLLVLEAFIGPRPSGMEGCHGDGDQENNYFGNLRWDTHLANMEDRRLSLVRRSSHAGTGLCRLGHPLAAPNLALWALATNRLRCLACDRAKSYRRNVDPAVDMQATSDRYFVQIVVAHMQTAPPQLGGSPCGGAAWGMAG